MIRWVKVKFKPDDYKEYSYLCKFQDVKRGDMLVVDAQYSGICIVECTSIHSSTPPSIATKNIMDIYRQPTAVGKKFGTKIGVASRDLFDEYGNAIPSVKKEKDMKEMKGFGNLGDRMMNRFFRKVDGLVWDLFTGRVGVKTPEGITTIEGTGDNAQLVINLFDEFGMAIPAFAQNTPLASVAIGDIIYQGNSVKGWVVEALGEADNVKRFKLMTPSGTATTWTPPKVSMLGFDSGIMVVRSLMTMLPGGANGLTGMQGMLLPMLAMGGDNVNLEKLMPLMLFSQLGTDGKGADALGGGNMMQMMMMMSLMGGKGSGGFFD